MRPYSPTRSHALVISHPLNTAQDQGPGHTCTERRGDRLLLAPRDENPPIIERNLRPMHEALLGHHLDITPCLAAPMTILYHEIVGFKIMRIEARSRHALKPQQELQQELSSKLSTAGALCPRP